MEKISLLHICLGVLLAACVPSQPHIAATHNPSPPPSEITATIQPPEVTAVPSVLSDGTLPDAPAAGKLCLVYVTQGNLWLLVEGKEPVLLLESGDVDQVKLSPDGSKVILSRQQNSTTELWIVDSSGWRKMSGEQVISGDIKFISSSDDEQRLAFFRVENFVGELWVADITNATIRRLVSREEELQTLEAGAFGVNFFEVLWISGTHRISYASSIFPIQGGGDSLPDPDPVFIVDADSGKQTVFLPTGEGGHITYLPDGKSMVVANASSVKLMRVDQPSQTQIIATYPTICGIPDCYIPQPRWRPDSSSFLVDIPSQEMNPENFLNGFEEPFTIWEVSADGAVKKKLIEFFRLPGTFSLSPDLQWVAYYGQDNTRDMHITSIDGSEDIRYTTDPDWMFYEWSPDSRHFVYQAHLDTAIMHGDVSGEATPLTNVLNALFLEWLNANQFLMYVGPESDLYLGTTNGESIRLAEDAGSASYDYTVIP